MTLIETLLIVPSEVRSWQLRMCATPPDHLRSEISFSRTGNILNLMSYTHCLELLTLETLHWLYIYMVAQLFAH